MSLVGDMVVQQANSPGTGTFNLTSVVGRSSFVATAGAGQVFYFVQDGASWEKGIGTVVSGAPDTLSRDTVLGNSLGTTAKINFAGSVIIECNIPAERSIWASADNSAVLVGNRKQSGVAAAVASSDGARLDQVGWQRISADVNPAGVAVVGFTLPAGFVRYRLEWSSLNSNSSSAGFLHSRFSLDGGSTYDVSTHYWFGLSVRVGGGSETYSTSTTGTYTPLSAGQTGVQVSEGSIEFSTASGRGFVDSIVAAATIAQVSGWINFTQANANFIVLALSAGAFTSGAVRLLGWKTP